MWLFCLFAPSQSSAPAPHLVFGGSEKTKLQYTPLDKSQLLRAGSLLRPLSVSGANSPSPSSASVLGGLPLCILFLEGHGLGLRPP